MSNFYGAIGLIGGATGDLDLIDGAGLADGDGAVVIIDGACYHYHLDATSGESESSPDIIAPDTNPGTKRWLLCVPKGVVGFVDRGDPAANDFLVSDLTTDGTWRDMDLGPGGENIVPAGAKAILINLGLTDETPNQNFKFRKNGNSNALNIANSRTQVNGIRNDITTIVQCDANGVIEYNAENTTWTGIWIIIMGWWM